MPEKFLNQDGVKILWELFKDSSPRRDNHFNYQDNFIPKKGQICFVDTPSDGLQVKVGDGLTQWSELNYLTASETQAGLIKMYNTVGENTDGTMSQKAITNELNNKVEVTFDVNNETLSFIKDNNL